MKTIDRFTPSVLAALRSRFGKDETDTSRDADIAKLSPEDALRNVVAWHLGDQSWAGVLIGWARGCGYEVKEKGESK